MVRTGRPHCCALSHPTDLPLLLSSGEFAGNLCTDPKFSACQKFIGSPDRPKIQPHLTVYLSPGIPNASPTASGHTTNDPQLLLHDPKPAHHHTTVPPATGEHHPTVCPGPAPALLQLSATAAAAEVSIWMVVWSRLLAGAGAVRRPVSIGRCSGSESHDPAAILKRTAFWKMTEVGSVAASHSCSP